MMRIVQVGDRLESLQPLGATARARGYALERVETGGAPGARAQAAVISVSVDGMTASESRQHLDAVLAGWVPVLARWLSQPSQILVVVQRPRRSMMHWRAHLRALQTILRRLPIAISHEEGIDISVNAIIADAGTDPEALCVEVVDLCSRRDLVVSGSLVHASELRRHRLVDLVQSPVL